MPAEKDIRPIIVIKKKSGHGGHHGGAWKVAYADFVTAMMSLFIVLWLMNSTPQVKQAVAGYFNDPKGTGKETGSQSLGSGTTVSVDQQNIAKLKEQIEAAIVKQADLEKLARQVEITVTGEGLKIELLEDKSGTFFDSGSPNLNQNGEKLLLVIANQIKDLPNHLTLEGHTDAQPYSTGTAYTNWELSSDRANSARRILQQGGVDATKVSQVRGYAAQSLRLADKPLDPANRRISIIVQWLPTEAPAAAASAGKSAPSEGPTPAPPATATPGPAPAPESKAANQSQPAPQTAAPATSTPTASASSPQIPAAHPPTAAVPAKPTLISRLQTILPGKKGP